MCCVVSCLCLPLCAVPLFSLLYGTIVLYTILLRYGTVRVRWLVDIKDSGGWCRVVRVDVDVAVAAGQHTATKANGDMAPTSRFIIRSGWLVGSNVQRPPAPGPGQQSKPKASEVTMTKIIRNCSLCSCL